MVSRSVSTGCRQSPADPHRDKEEVNVEGLESQNAGDYGIKSWSTSGARGSQPDATYRRFGLIDR